MKHVEIGFANGTVMIFNISDDSFDVRNLVHEGYFTINNELFVNLKQVNYVKISEAENDK